MSGGLARREAANAGAHWIAYTHPVPEQVWEEWDSPVGVALVPAGRHWDAVAMPYDRLLTVIADMGPAAWEHTPVLADMSCGRTYVFVPEGTAGAWREPGTTAIGRGSWLVMSKPGGRQLRVGQWVNPPSLITRLTNPADLSASMRRTAHDDKPEEGF
ncbi:hypothetical protein ABZ508_34250 [Streptomyces lavendulocolor]|uniref:DNA primase/polymerase bifunctional N-terminal domain-containing protein n=1 Tax=Streptomyces lavendulocolor TaxID=67316 RepID=A0ABV2WGE4_9ACTN